MRLLWFFRIHEDTNEVGKLNNQENLTNGSITAPYERIRKKRSKQDHISVWDIAILHHLTFESTWEPICPPIMLAELRTAKHRESPK